MSPPLLLALDTATATASVALFDGEQVLAESTWVAGRAHSARLLDEVAATLARTGRERSDLSGVVVAHGPGSFTGVRVAVSTAKGIAAALELPMWGVSTLAAAARGAPGYQLPVRAVVDAGRERVATALFLDGQQVDEMRGVSFAELGQLDRDLTLLVGDLPPTLRAALAEYDHLRLLPPAVCLRRAGPLAELGWALWQSGEVGDPAAVDAVYLGR